MDMNTLETFLGWCLVVNIGVLLIWALAMLTGDWAMRLQTGVSKLDLGQVRALNFQLMGQFKLLIFIFNLAPWLALVIMGD